MLNVVFLMGMLSVVMPNVVLLSAVAQTQYHKLVVAYITHDQNKLVCLPCFIGV